MSWIRTYRGYEFNYENIENNNIDIHDIAHGLSNMCRFAGHTKYFYSVAQHSVACADKAYDISQDRNFALCALLHDGSEAYLMDIPRPLKPLLKNYTEIETKIQNLINKKLSVDTIYDAYKDRIKEIDNKMLLTEAEQLIAKGTEGFTMGNENCEKPYRDVTLSYMTSTAAEKLFLNRYVFYKCGIQM